MDLDALAQRLRGHVWALVAPSPGAGAGERVGEALMRGLSEGLPLMLWSLVPELDSPVVRQTIVDWLCGTPHARLPELLHEIRRNTHTEWQDLAALWDDPRRPLPDQDFPAHQPD